MMRHYELFKNALRPKLDYASAINIAINTLNASAVTKRTEDDSSHVEERSAIFEHLLACYPDKTLGKIIADTIAHPSILDKAVEDYMVYNLQSFPGHPACVLPQPYILGKRHGLHVVHMLEGSLTTGITSKTTTQSIKPATVLCYFNERLKDWVSFRVDDAELYRITKDFKDTCINNGLQLIDGRGNRDEFTPLVEYIRAYKECNKALLVVKQQYDHIGWDMEKHGFISPRDKTRDIVVNNEEYQNDVNSGYIQRGSDPAKNVNEMLGILKEFPLACAIYATPFTNPLINGVVIDSNCLTIDLYGPPGKGKNLLQYAAINPMGDSREQPKSRLMKSWIGSSGPGITSMIAFHRSHTVCIEESHMADERILSDTIYKTFNGVQGEKAEQSGTTRKNQRLFSHLICSGETSIQSRVKQGGLSRRMLPINISDVLGDLIYDTDALDKFQQELGKALNRNFGIALDPFVDFMVAHREHLQVQFQNYLDKYKTGQASSFYDQEKHKTYAEFVASIHLVLDNLHEMYKLSSISKEEIAHICQSIHEYCNNLCIKQNKNIEALSAVYTHATTNEDKYFTPKSRNGTSNHAQAGVFREIKVDGVMEPCLLFENNELKKFLKDAGYAPENALSAWKKAGVLYGKIGNKGDGRTAIAYSIQTRLNGSNVRSYCTVFLLGKVRDIVGVLEDGYVEIDEQP